tara:strand:+ start:28 stop:444 length:417 start_codon:yes stop_codon:yes gene_type:complete
MFGISAKLPLRQDSRDGGYALTKTYKENIAQNLKNLLLTVPGERIMDPNFGVGLREYLFEPNVSAIHLQINQNIREQVKIYLPFVSVEAVNFLTTANQSLAVANFIAPEEEHRLSIEVVYKILPIDIIDALVVKVDLT